MGNIFISKDCVSLFNAYFGKRENSKLVMKATMHYEYNYSRLKSEQLRCEANEYLSASGPGSSGLLSNWTKGLKRALQFLNRLAFY